MTVLEDVHVQWDHQIAKHVALRPHQSTRRSMVDGNYTSLKRADSLQRRRFMYVLNPLLCR